MKDINGFVFNAIGELIKEPKQYTLELLQSTLDELYCQNEYISASRITQRINMFEAEL